MLVRKKMSECQTKAGNQECLNVWMFWTTFVFMCKLKSDCLSCYLSHVIFHISHITYHMSNAYFDPCSPWKVGITGRPIRGHEQISWPLIGPCNSRCAWRTAPVTPGVTGGQRRCAPAMSAKLHRSQLSTDWILLQPESKVFSQWY